MKQIKCPKCGRNYYLDNNPVCPFCGGDNSTRQFKEHEIPKTIEELKIWYAERNLPHENITRFFIGKNVNEAKAFGIYEENGEFIVYKNKANGERAIRYHGPNEAFAVKEIYVKLKEEIVNQKQRNGSYGSDEQSKRKRKNRKSVLIITICIILLPFVITLTAFAISNYKDSLRAKEHQYYRDPQGDFYIMDELHLDTYDWFILDVENKEWDYYITYTKDTDFPEGVTRKMIVEGDVIEEETGLTYKEYSFFNSIVYKDRCRTAPSSSYYFYNDDLYYYFDDDYGSYFGDTPNLSGWYIFDEEDEDWVYYADFDDRDYFDDEFWYYYEDYEYDYDDYNDYFYDYYGEEYIDGEYEFENTDYYLTYEESVEDYNEWSEEQKTKYTEDYYDDDDDDSDWWSNDSDSDYDWDDDDDWDSSDTDWDSDW